MLCLSDCAGLCYCAGYAFNADENTSCLILNDVSETNIVSASGWTLFIKSDS